MRQPIHDSSGRAPARPYSRVIRAAGLVFTAGHVAIDLETAATIGTDVTAQTEAVLQGLARTLNDAGLQLDDVVSVRVLLRDIADVDAMDAVYRQHFTEPYPVRTTAAVSALGRPELLVEIDVIAADRAGSEPGPRPEDGRS